ncbi:unnamed protein product [Cyclocybe aegerita]|uniref:Protein kinase domain-containing protein n=1 Tax=Cyclocybe aegerita TaxID=1973307 RepID=A0A8S0VW10_CYCAE|nr:unnamed protein product [Cyclocybe aegerita]
MPSRDSRVTFQVADARPQFSIPEPHYQSYKPHSKPSIDAYFYKWPPIIRGNGYSLASPPTPPRGPIHRSKSISSTLNRAAEGKDESKSSTRNLKGKSPATAVRGKWFLEPTFRWIKGELIGKGSHGKVYLAFNATSGEIMAVKQVERPLTKSDRMKSDLIKIVDTLREEREHMKNLEHPNIVQYLGFEENEATVNIFLEYVSGGSIGGCLKTHGPFKDDVTRYFTAQILEGLSYLHANGIVHRDLKGDNILVEDSGVCKISDFGISKKLAESDRAFSFKGTSYWMAPETLRTGGSGQGYDMKVDVWSVGCIVFEMWTAKRPWLDENIMSVLIKLSEAKVIPPLPDDCNLSPLALHFRSECFKLNPEERPSATLLLGHPYLDLPTNWSFPGMSDMGYKSLRPRPPPRKPRGRNESPASANGTGASDIAKMHSTIMDVNVSGPDETPGSPALTMNSSISRSGVRPLPPTPIPSIWKLPRPSTPPLVTITPVGPRKPKSLGRSNSVAGGRSSNSSLLSEAGDPPVIRRAGTQCNRQPRSLVLHGSKPLLDISRDFQKAVTISEDGKPSLLQPYTYIPPALPEKTLTTAYSTHLSPQVKFIEPVARYPVEHLQLKSHSSIPQTSLPPQRDAHALPSFARRESIPSGSPSSRGQSTSIFSDSDSASGSIWQKPPPGVPQHRHRSKLSGQEETSDIPPSSGEEYQSSSSNPRRVSAFAGPTRPGVREVFENLQEFFPKHNLDEPVMESPIDGTNRVRANRVTMRSIKTIAEEQISRGSVDSPQCRRQTRLWDSRLEEIKIP